MCDRRIDRKQIRPGVIGNGGWRLQAVFNSTQKASTYPIIPFQQLLLAMSVNNLYSITHLFNCDNYRNIEEYKLKVTLKQWKSN